ncbi:MAG: DUF3575 domain-containing protein [Bacteroidales bacterium]|nr:DUF3575 domain-containing protein [Bacteroidales bacterium]
MQTGRITARIFASIAAKVAMAVLFVFCNAFFVRARDSRANEIERVRVHFPFDNAELRSNYMNNESSLISLRQLLEATDGNIDVEVIAYSSPEGNESYNKSLSARRAASVKNFVLSLFPDSKPTVKVISVSEAWEQFRAYVAADKSLDAASRSELLLVIDSDSKADEKESLIKADPNYKRLYSKYFRSLRYAEISLKLSSAAVFGLVNTNASVPGMGVSFANGSSRLDLTNKETVDALNAMVAFFRENPSAADDYVIAGAASPEGPTSANNRLALMRAKAVADYISEKAPELKGKLHIKAAGEDWNGLRNAILAEDSLSSTDKQQLCAIIDSNASADEKEAALKNHPAYQTVRDNCFGALRRQSIAPADSATSSSSTAVAPGTAEGKDTASSADKGVAGMGVSFRNGSSKLDPNYKDNKKALDEMVAFFRENPSAVDEYVIVGSSASDGSTPVDERLARQRAQAIADYISEQAPELKGKLNTKTTSEDWNGLRRQSTDTAESASKSSDKGVAGMGISFRNGSSKLDPNYKDNKKALDEMVAFFRENPSAADEYDIVGAASPDGPTSVNDRLARERAQAVADYISEQAPELKDRLHTRSAGEDWNGLRKAVLAEDSLSDKDKKEICEIIDSNASADEKEKALKDHPAYETVRENCFDPLRSQSIELAENRNNKTAETTVIEVVEEKKDTVKDTVIAVVENETIIEKETAVEDTLRRIERLPGIYSKAVRLGEDYPVERDTVVKEKEYERELNMIAGLKTNLLYDAATAVNVELEIPIWEQTSLNAEFVTPWWETGNKYCFQIQYVSAEFRYWFKPWEGVGVEKLRGWFAAPYVAFGQYDFQYDKQINYQGEFWSAGLTAGYSMAIGKKKKANLEFSLSLGYLQSPFRHYYPTDDYSKLIHDPYRDGTLYWLGPTKAKVSLVIPICIPTGKTKEVNND